MKLFSILDLHRQEERSSEKVANAKAISLVVLNDQSISLKDKKKLLLDLNMVLNAKIKKESIINQKLIASIKKFLGKSYHFHHTSFNVIEKGISVVGPLYTNIHLWENMEKVTLKDHLQKLEKEHNG